MKSTLIHSMVLNDIPFVYKIVVPIKLMNEYYLVYIYEVTMCSVEKEGIENKYLSDGCDTF